MCIRAFRPILILALCLAIVAPMAMAAVAGIGFSGTTSVLICTGDGLRKVTLDPDGKPVKISDSVEHCALPHTLDTADRPPPLGAIRAAESARYAALPVPPRLGPAPTSADLIRAPPLV